VIKRFGWEDDAEAIEIIKRISKENLFAKKKLQEENKEYRAYLERKKKIEDFSRWDEKINDINIREDIDWGNEE
jgi:hypothetical protein